MYECLELELGIHMPSDAHLIGAMNSSVFANCINKVFKSREDQVLGPITLLLIQK